MGRVELAVTQVGFPTLSGHSVVRNGAWTPVTVTLSLIDQPGFDGTLRVAQFDSDGDAGFDRVEVHLRAATGGTRRYRLYVLAKPQRGECRFAVELFDASGEAIEVVSQGVLTSRAKPAGQPTQISDDDVLLLSVSHDAVGRIKDLVGTRGGHAFSREVYLSHVSLAELPEHWIGLETVDDIIWDDARPEELTERQLEALLEWVRQGGALLITASRTAGSVVASKRLNKVLPVDLGEVLAVDNLIEVRNALVGTPTAENVQQLGSDWLAEGFPSAVPVVRCTAREGATVIATDSLSKETPPILSDVVTRRRLGRGHITFSGITLADLFSAEGTAPELFSKLLHLRQVSDKDAPRPQPVSLFHAVAGAISFATSASLYLLAAAVLSIAYLLAATFGGWRFLRKRGWQQHSWTAFALTAAATSAVTVVAIHSMRGFGDRLHQMSIVDADAGSRQAFATVLFGLKTSIDKRLDVWLPSDPLSATEPQPTSCFLRPIPGDTNALAGSTSYADPEEYRLTPASAVVNRVRLRGTLKQFEGWWNGLLPGSLTGKITIRRGRITPDSSIVNGLGVDLYQCLLLQPMADIHEMKGPRDGRIRVFSIGDILSGNQETLLASRCYRPAPNETLGHFLAQSTLATAQTQWGKMFRTTIGNWAAGSASAKRYTTGQEKTALLLLSTVGEFDFTALTGMVNQWAGPSTFSRDRLRRLDLREQLDTESVMLIGFSHDPGPIRLFARQGQRSYAQVEPDPAHSTTMYRIRIPVTRLDSDFENEDNMDLSEEQSGASEGV